LRSPALSAGIGRFNNDILNPGVGIGGFNMPLASPGIGMGLSPGMPVSPFVLQSMLQPEVFQHNVMLLLQQQSEQAANQRMNKNVRTPGVKTSVSGRTDKKDEEEIDLKLLEDVPGWLRSLRLHKYTPNFEGMSWKDMVNLDEAQLEAKGVAALGARRKMLKTFEVVRKKFPDAMTTPA